ncbi:hypothetical protein XA68_12338 [Ophiocordyceps unilateralis]|uniref:Amino acid permease/ SLC12A domain-containing protein n=1 Tax=Ophiocordyceps unilateralis TaxID=268505 RepID=A0A2A9PQZ3_OPHUN|nr:hypothetical protein XA68_12338 [Ophiocordyceps unilateralis]
MSPSTTGPGPDPARNGKLGIMSGVFIPVFLSIMSILMFLRFGLILGQVGLVGIAGLLLVAYCINLLTTLSLSAIASNGEVKGGGAYFVISRSLGPEFGGSIGLLFFVAQALNTALNIIGLIDSIRLNAGDAFPTGYWAGYALQTAALVLCTALCLLGSSTFSKASAALLTLLTLAVISIPVSIVFKSPFHDKATGVQFTGFSLDTLMANLLPRDDSPEYHGLATFRELFGILFPATAGIFAGASMSGDLKDPSKAIPAGTLWATLTTLVVYAIVVLSLAASTTRESLLANNNVLFLTNIFPPIILAGECSVTFVSALICMMGCANLFQALARDRVLPGLSVFGKGSRKSDVAFTAILLTYALVQVALLADLNRIAALISMGYQMTFLVMNLACFLLKIGSAPNFRPGFKFFSWQTALAGSLLSAAAMFFIHETYAAVAICLLCFLFLLIHYLCPPKRWGDVSQNLIYHQVRKYLLRLRPEHIKFWRPHIILLINDPRRQNRLIQFCNSMKKGSLYILGHVIVTEDFDSGVGEARLQQQAWSNYISEFSRIKAFLQLTMSPSLVWGIRNLILSAGLGGMRPNIAVLGFYNMDDLRRSKPMIPIPDLPAASSKPRRPFWADGKAPVRRREDSSSRLLTGSLPTDVIRTEGPMSPTDYMLVLEDLALKYRLNVAVAYGFESLETPRDDGANTKKYIDLWPIQMSAEVAADGKNVLTTNFDTYTLILQLGHILRSVRDWRRVYSLRVMVFVEYESEVDEESARLKALLEKLRIEAEVLVFWLAAGQLGTYELIVNGRTGDGGAEKMVDDALRHEEWWDDLQTYRGQAGEAGLNREAHQLVLSLDAAAGRAAVFDEGVGSRRRHSVTEVDGMPRNPDIGLLNKWGVNVGIHTHRLPENVLRQPEMDDALRTITECSDSDEEYGFASEHVVTAKPLSPVRRPLLRASGQSAPGPSSHREVGHGRWPEDTDGTLSSHTAAFEGIPKLVETTASPSPTREEGSRMAMGSSPARHAPVPVPSAVSLDANDRSRSQSPTSGLSARALGEAPVTPMRPSFSRQSSASRFSSRPVPETRVVAEAEGPTLSFAPMDSTPASQRVERPAHSRQSSWSKPFSRVSKADVAGESQARGAPRPPLPRQHSRHGSQHSYFGAQDGSSYSTQSVALSFNDLPSRAQHLILNELMRQHSTDTAVLMSTLPIPSEGTSLDEAATIRYLSDVEILCHGLPPTMMVLSNNMTVTVSL